MAKRAFDIVFSALGLLAAAPVIGLLVLAVRRDSAGPGIFRQRRIGRNGEPFVCLKLRTMRSDAPELPTHQSTADQVTRLGGRLRRWKLDELPQLWNVLTGDMSFVGPRPCLPSQTELIAERRKRGVLSIRPGITGLAQIRGVDMSDPVRLAELDARYLERMTLAADLKILLGTLSSNALADRMGE
jgi:lipopolysaccharide/colanic/teichoic acid biosynthesis glycosyltransferase